LTTWWLSRTAAMRLAFAAFLKSSWLKWWWWYSAVPQELEEDGADFYTFHWKII
jgi:hypothetical protein